MCGLRDGSAAAQDQISAGLSYSDRRILSWSTPLQFTRFRVKKNLTEINHKVRLVAKRICPHFAAAFAAKCAISSQAPQDGQRRSPCSSAGRKSPTYLPNISPRYAD